MKVKFCTPILDMPSSVYHSVPNTFSSSQLKDLLDDPEIFHAKHIAKTVPKLHIPAFDVGTYFHTAVLEPHKLKDEAVEFDGIRRGDKWEAFKKKHAGKAIVSGKQIAEAKGLTKAIKGSPVTMARLARCEPEVSMFVELLVAEGEIFVPQKNIVLTATGWVKAVKIPKKGVSIVMKVRADAKGPDFIMDLKSTTGNAKSKEAMKAKITYYNYDLSAALYLDMFSAGTGVLHRHFIWSFASKEMFNARSYRASEKNILIGRAKWRKAVLALADGLGSGWEFEDHLGVLEPQFHQLEWLDQGYSDLL